MTEIIIDGTGAGYGAKVTKENFLTTQAHTLVWAHKVNYKDGESYLVYTDITPTAANDVFMYIKNNSERDMIIDFYRAWTASGSPEAIDVYFNKIGTASGTTAITPVNMNLGSGFAADGDFYEGVDITGLSGGTFADRLRIIGGEDVTGDWPMDIVVPKNKIVTFQALTGAIALELTIGFYYDIRD